MRKSDLDAISRNLTGGDAESPNGRNLVGSINSLVNVLETVEEYPTVDTVSDLPPDLQDELADAHEDFQFHVRKLSNDISGLVGQDEAFEDENGNVVLDLPNAATEATGKTETPDPPRNDGQGGS